MSTRELRVSLDAELADRIEKQVQSGSYRSISELVTEAIRMKVDDDDTLERWLHLEIPAGHAEYLADPSAAIPAESVMDWIKHQRSKG